MKKVLTVLLVLVCAMSFTFANGSSETAAADTGSTGSNGVIYGIYKAGDQTWFIDEGEAAAAAANEAGYEFIYVDARMSPEEYLRAIDNAIANNAAGVVTCTPDQTLSRAVVDMLSAANIPVVAADDALEENGEKLAPWVGINAYVIGEANGQWLADYVKENNLAGQEGVGLLIMTMDTVSSCVPRAEGEYDRFTAECPEFPVDKIYFADYDGTTDKGYTAADAVFTAHPEITTISIVHNETTSGLINDLVSVSEVVKNHNLRFIVDAMSSFGAVDVNVAELGIDFLISSANKCIQGVPGFSFIIARREALTATEGNARTISLDLHSQWKTMEKDNGKWRFTSPTHVVAAFAQALKELQQEGGVTVRGERYAATNRKLREGMRTLGFEPFVSEAFQGPIITTFLYPEGRNLDFKHMHHWLKEQGYVIYPGKLTDRDTFRIGNIGEIYDADADRILELFAQYTKEFM